MNMARGRKDFLHRPKEKGNDREKALEEARGMGTVSLHLYVKIIS